LHSASYLIAGFRVHTPTITIRLLGESMRSQAVSTRDMRSTFSLKKSPSFRN